MLVNTDICHSLLVYNSLNDPSPVTMYTCISWEGTVYQRTISITPGTYLPRLCTLAKFTNALLALTIESLATSLSDKPILSNTISYRELARLSITWVLAYHSAN